MSDDDVRYERDEYSQDYPDDEDDESPEEGKPSSASRVNPFARPSGPSASGGYGSRPNQPMTGDELRRNPPGGSSATPPPGVGGQRPTPSGSYSGGSNPASRPSSGTGPLGSSSGGNNPSGNNPPRPNPPGGGYGSSSGSGNNPASRPGSGTGPLGSSSGSGSSNPSGNNPPRPNPPGGGYGSSSGSGNNPASRPSGTGPLGSSSSGGSSNPSGNNPPRPNPPGGGGSSSSGGNNPASRPSGTGPLGSSSSSGNNPAARPSNTPATTPRDDRRDDRISDPKKDDKKDEKKPDEGGGRFNMGGLLNRVQSAIPGRSGDGDKKPDDKKPTDKKDDKKPEESGGGLAGMASGLTGRLGGMFNRGGGDTADKKPADDPKKPVPPPSSSSSASSSAAPSRPGGMGASSSPSSASSAPGSRPSGPVSSPSSSSSSSSAPSSRPGSAPPPSSSAASSRPGGPTASSSTSAGAAKPKDDKAAAPAESGGGFLAGLRSKLPFGRGAETAVAASAAAGAAAKPGAAATPSKPAPGSTSQTKQAAAKAQAEPEGGGGIWEWMTGKRRTPATEPQSRTLREGSTRLPQADTSGWNLDTKLDLIGIGLILGAVVLGLSALSAEQANVTGSINRFIGQLLGWGAFAVPMTMGGVGIFLLVTRFGDSPPELDMVRIAGVVLAYIGLLTLFQYIEVLGPRYQCDLDCFRIVVQRSYQDGRGGGIIGMNTHLFLVENIGEIGGFVFVMGLMLVAGMLITRTTATELMVLFVSLYRSFRVSWQHQSQRRAAQRQIAATRRAEAARITVSRPGALEAGRAEVRQPALPMGAEPMVRVGGQVVTSASVDASAASAQAGAGGAFRGLLNRLPGRKPDSAPAAAPSSPVVTQRSAESGNTSFAPPVSQPAAAAAPAAMMPPPPPPAPPPAQVVQPAAAQPVSAPANPTAVEGPTVGVAPNLPITPPKAPPLVHSITPRHDYNVPEFRQLLNPGSKADYDRKALVERARIIQETLESFGAPGKVVEINTGPVITQFGVEPGYVTQRDRQSRVKVSAIAQLDKDLQLSLGARSIRIEAPVPGKGYVGIEVPNDNPMTVSLRDVMEANRFQRIKSPLAIALGESVDGTPVAADLTSMPHLLIAGTTGSGKSVCVNAIIASLLLRNTPDQVKFIMVDPKRVELTGYNGIPHLIAPVVVDVERIIGVLKWLTREMDDRYKKFSVAGARNIDDYNRNRAADVEAMPYIVAIIDELADLMMLAPEEAERYITRVAAMARATGIHLVIATQRPSADVVTGLIKANFPARIAFAVAGNVDSRVILDQPGAEKLLGRGDMLYLSADSPSAQRLQGVFVSDSELNSIIRYWKAQAVDQPQKPAFNFGVESDEGNKPARPAQQQSPYSRPTVGTPQQVMPPGLFDDMDEDDDYEEEDGGGSDDDLFERAVELVRRQNGASVSLLQRKMRIGYARAARLIDAMEERGIVGPQKEGSSKQRDVLIPK